MKYVVQVSETLQRLVEVEADSNTDAESIVHRQYCAGELVLDSSDYIATEITIV